MKFLNLILFLFMIYTPSYAVTGTLGQRGVTSIVPLDGVLKKTKIVDLTLDAFPTGWTPTRVKGMAWADSNGVWTAWITVKGTITSAASGAFDFNGTSFELGSPLYGALAVGVRVEVAPADNSLVNWSVSGGATPQVSFSGTVLLTEEPTWAAANLETTDASVYVQSASPTQDGLVNTIAQSFAGNKNFTSNLGVGVATPTSDIHLEKSDPGVNTDIFVQNTSSAADSVAAIYVYNDAAKNGVMRTRGTSTAGNVLGKPRATTTEISSNQDLAIGTLGANDLTLSTNNTARMTIDSLGNVGHSGAITRDTAKGKLVWEDVYSVTNLNNNGVMNARIYHTGLAGYGTGYIEAFFSGTVSGGANRAYAYCKRFYKVYPTSIAEEIPLGADLVGSGATCTMIHDASGSFTFRITNAGGLLPLTSATLYIKIVAGGNSGSGIRGITDVVFSTF